jgi:hypothetical protein
MIGHRDLPRARRHHRFGSEGWAQVGKSFLVANVEIAPLRMAIPTH